MNLGWEQEEFSQDLMMLLSFIHGRGLRVRIGEVQRPLEMQAIYVKTGRSKTMDGYHLKKLAADLFIFKDGRLLGRTELVEVGAFWEGLDPKNSWGGNWNSFKDVPHFERRV